MSTQICYGTESLIPSFYETLNVVAHERVYLEMVEAPPFAEILSFQRGLISNHWPVYYAVDADKVVGWVDINILKGPPMEHRGVLGMGLLQGYRHQGLGRKLLQAAIEHATNMGLEKIELQVYTENTGAIALYRKMGFVEEGLQRHFRKLDERYFDCMLMAKFL
jgi:putative acetyltransferase